MVIRIISIGNKMPSWINEGYYEYAKRFTGTCTLELLEIPPEKRTKNSDIPRLIQREGEKILAAVKPGSRIIALDVKGQSWKTEQLADHLKSWQRDSRPIDLVIGGADGLSAACLNKAEIKWSLSPLTLPHPIVRILIAEQLYRALTILQGHPYHRA